MCKQKQNGRREMHKCFLYRVIWTITSNYPNNDYSSMFNKIHAIHNNVYSLLKIENAVFRAYLW